ncbi:MAG: hypothetical protein A2729_05360 [Candidatus Buchananbacteria bacterium RIFCSPHIGHO2_01_FULL_39_14]|uniref:Transcriptional repressor n=1 Tax=Candidatus Buchananbacteria bacterium RIFCSPHIGHO2_01_FULL_39_14 TaxID=1797532 RepID=A0A1G1XTB2_9BACT|nr:MAG: hypothetical protein A2729_05360 [Candidatus Buchananbacteria bacterium RIFCSPHIGHO2_01_FULL_39_14]
MKNRTLKTRFTSQKVILESEVEDFTSFFTAEELHGKIRRSFPKIGIATIYRYLKSAVERGEVHSFQCERRAIYSTNSKNHCHFYCEVCGEKKHITLQNIGALQKGIRGKMCHFQIDVVGICEECLRK